MSLDGTVSGINATLRACRATRHLAGRIVEFEFLTPEGKVDTGIDAQQLDAVLRELVAIVDTSPASAITPDVRALAERSRHFILATAAFVHGPVTGDA